ncbi:MAG TPA: hypothetical protein VEX68_08865 [Bryobacteraceae bacterium]|nr:hypothetical protein [Bryobacteraceae bacterium]
MQINKTIVNTGVLLISAGVSLLLCEGAVRLILNPADYLSLEMIPDNVLGAAPPHLTGRTGIDDWGFRNPSVPQTADILAIGDSHTYGNTATMQDSWPSTVARLTGRNVYNMGLGGYGPNQYLYLLKTKGITLKPRTVVCALYMGDDFENAYLITYGLDHWAWLRRLSAQDVNFNIWQTPHTPSWNKRVRIWFSQHSVAYQLAFHGSFLGRLQGEAQIRNASKIYDSTVTLDLPQQHILEAFRPQSMLIRLDQSSEAVREGMRITFELLREMNDICRTNHAKFLVTVIPTKEMVFSRYLEHNQTIALNDVIDQLVANERMARARTFDFLRSANIAYVDPLPGLQAAVGKELYARTAADMHPGKNGYHVIGEAISAALQHPDHVGERRYVPPESASQTQ